MICETGPKCEKLEAGGLSIGLSDKNSSKDNPSQIKS